MSGVVANRAAALWLINDLVHLAMGEVTRLLLIRAMAAMLVTVVLMTAMQPQTRGYSHAAIDQTFGLSP